MGLMVDRYPLLYRLWWRYSPKSKAITDDFIVHNNTDIVIEGFPRSGNSFAYAAFLLANGHNFVVSHHVHRPSQIILAAERRIPTLVIIRPPIDAVVSLVIFRPFLSVKQALRSYIDFYGRIKPWRDNFLLTTFGDVTRDFGAVLDELNNKFNTSFSEFHHTAENVEKCFAMVEQFSNQFAGHHDERLVARPSRKREDLKSELKQELADSRLRHLIEQAETLYAWYAQNSGK
jgi:hypothetical protein